MRRCSQFFIALTVILMLAGCGTFFSAVGGDDYVTAAYKTLKSGKILYEDGMAAAADAWRLGLISENDRARITAAGERFRIAWQASADALYAYAVADAAPSDATGLERELALFEQAYAEFARMVRPYLIKALTR